jgi:hypothetical protein
LLLSSNFRPGFGADDPKVIDPGPPPSDALVLFDGQDLSKWTSESGGAARWTVQDGTATVNGTGSILTKQEFGDCQLHVEWAAPAKVEGEGQGRGNSGVYLQGRYEVQVLDSFGLAGLDNECGGIYKQAAPKVNMCFPPLQWQTYDIDFQAARLDESGKVIKAAAVTVKHNGVVIQEGVELKAPTSRRGAQGGALDQGPINLQFHANPVFYRNLWLVEKK